MPSINPVPRPSPLPHPPPLATWVCDGFDFCTKEDLLLSSLCDLVACNLTRDARQGILSWKALCLCRGNKVAAITLLHPRPRVKSWASVIKEEQALRTGDTEPRERRKHRWSGSRLSYLLHEPSGDHNWKCLPSGHTPPYTESPNFHCFPTSLDVGPNSVVVTLNCLFRFVIKRYIREGGGYSAAFLKMGLPAGLTPRLCLGGLLSKLEVGQSPGLY